MPHILHSASLRYSIMTIFLRDSKCQTSQIISQATEPVEETTSFPSIYCNVVIENTRLDHKIKFAL
jgi:hypothetical protein